MMLRVMAELHAWVDESGSHQALDPYTYILAAALCPQDAMDDVRALMQTLRAPGSPKLHWRDETKPARRAAIAAAVSSCETIEHLIVVRSGVAVESHRRPRSATLKHLLFELDQRQVKRAVFESRGTADDRRDVEVVRNLRDRQQAISPALKVDHVPGPNDAGLWVADALCGAVSSSRTGEPRYLEMLAARVTMITIDKDGHPITA